MPRPGMMNLGVTSDVTLIRLTSPLGARTWLAAGVLAVVVLAAQASAVTVSGALVADDASATPKLYHAALMLAGVLLLARQRIARPRTELLLYFAVTGAATLVAYMVFEPRVAGLKLLIALYIALVAGSVGRVATAPVVIRACRLASVAFLVLVTVKNVWHLPAFVAYLANPSGHPDVPSFAGGGLNLEATWLALSSIFLIGTVLFVPYVLAAAATSALYASRAGVMIACVAACAALAYVWGTRRASRPPASRRMHPDSHSARLESAVVARRVGPGPVGRRILAVSIALGAIGAGIAAAVVASEYGDAAYVARRFATIGDEPGSLGRLTLWRGGLRVFAEYPLGVGAGNAVPMLRRVLGVDVPEDNLHNIYLQHAVETGLPGVVVLLVVAVMVGRRLVTARFRDQLLLFVAAYLVAGTIQFTGTDALLWLVYGLQSGASAGGSSG